MVKINEKWLDLFKKHLKYPFNDNDENLQAYLEICLENICTQYLEIDKELLFQSVIDELQKDTKIRIATFHLASQMYANPDLNNVNNFGNVIDTDQLYRILGDRTNYFAAYNQIKAAVPEIENALQNELNKINKNIADLQNQDAIFNKNFETVNNEIQQLKTEQTQILEKVTNLEKAKIDLENLISELSQKIENLPNDFVTLKTDQEITALKTFEKIQSFTIPNNENDLTNKKYVDLENEKLNNQIENLKNKDDELNTEIENVKNQLPNFVTLDTEQQINNKKIFYGNNPLIVSSTTNKNSAIELQSRHPNNAFVTQFLDWKDGTTKIGSVYVDNVNDLVIEKYQNGDLWFSSDVGKIILGTENHPIEIRSGTDINLNLDHPETGRVFTNSNPTQDTDLTTKKYVDDEIKKIEIPEIDLSSYYTKSETDSEIETAINNIDYSNFYTKTETNTEINNAINNLNISSYYTIANADNTFIKKISLDEQMVNGPMRFAPYGAIFSSGSSKPNRYAIEIQAKYNNTNLNQLIAFKTGDEINWMLTSFVNGYLYLIAQKEGVGFRIQSNNNIEDVFPDKTKGHTTNKNVNDFINDNEYISKNYVDTKISEINIPEPADLTNYYTKPETNTKIETAINDLNISNYYNKTETDTKIETVNNNLNTNYYDKTETDNLLNSKQNVITNYVTTNSSQTISAAKTFSVNQNLTATPNSNNHLINKSFLDTSINSLRSEINAKLNFNYSGVYGITLNRVSKDNNSFYWYWFQIPMTDANAIKVMYIKIGDNTTLFYPIQTKTKSNNKEFTFISDENLGTGSVTVYVYYLILA